MKFVYTILFFVDTLVLLWLAYLFMKLTDAHSSQLICFSILAGIIGSIALLVHLILRYLRLPASGSKNE